MRSKRNYNFLLQQGDIFFSRGVNVRAGGLPSYECRRLSRVRIPHPSQGIKFLVMLEKYKEQLEEKMHNQCVVFCTMGSPIESPRWINIHEKYEQDGKYYFKFASTNAGHIYFYIEVELSDYRKLIGDIWSEFKIFRTKFLEEHYPTIKVY